MAIMASHLLNAGEIEFYVQTLKCSYIENIGSKNWFSEHKILEHLRQEAIFEATNFVEERVMEMVNNYEKFPVLLYEAISIQLWRDKIWKKVLKVKDQEIKNGFFIYMILYHECTAVNFIQILIHHKETISALKDISIDLIDYCASQIIFIITSKFDEKNSENELERLSSQQKEMGLNIGLGCIAILASLSEYLDELPISAVSRLYDTHDVPLLIVSLLQTEPWRRRNSQDQSWQYHCEGQWTVWDPEELCKSEAQCWIGIRGLLLHQAAVQHYEMTEFRKQSLMKLQKYLHERVIDQMSPLLELKQYLAQLAMAGSVKPNRTPLILETVASMKDSLASQTSKWKNLRELHMDIIFNEDQHKDDIIEIAKSLAETYEFEKMAPIKEGAKSKEKCEDCGNLAFKRCSQCRNAWYCSRKCQVNNWKIHKDQCVKSS